MSIRNFAAKIFQNFFGLPHPMIAAIMFMIENIKYIPRQNR